MKQLKPRDKVTQRMTRDGLTLDNQTTGESANISSREAEQELTAQPGGAAEKVLERAGAVHDRHKAKQAARDAGKVVAEGGEALHRPASRLQFTAEERASPELAPYIKKSEKRADKLDAAKEALPKKRVLTKETVYDAARGRAVNKLHFEKVEKEPPKLKPGPMSRPAQEAGLYLHGKIHEVEQENVGVEGGHKGEELAERQAGKAIRSARRRHKLKPYRAAARAEQKSIAANAEFVYQKSLRDNPEMAQAVKNPVSRLWQKQKIKREYARAARAAGQTAQGAAGAAANAAKNSAAAAKRAAKESKKTASFVARHWKGVLLVGGVGLMLLLIMGGLQSCTAMFGSAGTGLAATSYLSEDEDMLGAEAAYSDLEADLQHELDNYKSLHPGYDEYRFDLDTIGHDPYVLISILSALHEGVFTMDEVQSELQTLFDRQYTLTETVTVEVRYRTETRTDSEGNEYDVEVPYNYYILNVTLTSKPISSVALELLTPDQLEMYQVYRQTLGNKPLIFGGGSADTSDSESLAGVEFVNGTRPGNQAVVDIAKSQVGNVGGQPYWSWYGFNSRVEWCACFVSWCYGQMGLSEPRFAACQSQGIPWFQSHGQWGGRDYANIAPGDAIFFDWDLDGSADHVGIVVGTDGSRVYTVEGNSGDACKIKSYSLTYECIKGYGLMNW